MIATMKVRITRAGDAEYSVGTVVLLTHFVLMVKEILEGGGEMPIAVLMPD